MVIEELARAKNIETYWKILVYARFSKYKKVENVIPLEDWREFISKTLPHRKHALLELRDDFCYIFYSDFTIEELAVALRLAEKGKSTERSIFTVVSQGFCQLARAF